MTSLDEQLAWLRQKPREAMMYGFGYAPTASTHLLCESNLGEHVFDFSAPHIASSISSLSASGMTDLQSFRSNEVTREGAQRMPSVEVVSDESDIPDSALMEIDIDSESLACLHPLFKMLLTMYHISNSSTDPADPRSPSAASAPGALCCAADLLCSSANGHRFDLVLLVLITR